MLISMTKYGAGKALNASSYLLREFDSKGIKREAIEVLRGSPKFTAQISDTLIFSKKYGSGVIAYHIEDWPTDEEINETIDELEKLAFGGLEKDRYSFSVIKHVEPDQSVHLHFFLHE